MTVLVTGATGNAGRRVVDELLALAVRSARSPGTRPPHGSRPGSRSSRET
ncbi:hypothetical protein [Lentzea jiangxiensis]